MTEVEVSSVGKGLPMDMGLNHQGRKVSLPLTPPASPWVKAAGEVVGEPEPLDMGGEPAPRVVLLYVGRM